MTQRFERIIYYISLLFIAVAVMYLYYRVYRDWLSQGKQILLKLKLYMISTRYPSSSLSLSDSFGVSNCTEDVVVPIPSTYKLNSSSYSLKINSNALICASTQAASLSLSHCCFITSSSFICEVATIALIWASILALSVNKKSIIIN